MFTVLVTDLWGPSSEASIFNDSTLLSSSAAQLNFTIPPFCLHWSKENMHIYTAYTHKTVVSYLTIDDYSNAIPLFSIFS